MLCLLVAAPAGAQHVQTDPNGMAFLSTLTSDTEGVYRVFNIGSTINGNVYTPPNPGYGSGLMWIAGPTIMDGVADIDTDLTDGVQSYAEYTVRFTSEGTYRVFWSGQRTGSPQQLAEGGAVSANDSLWIGGVDADHTATSGWTQLALAAGGISWRQSDALWVIDNTNVNQDLTLTIGLREDGPIYDRLAFVLEGSGITGAMIDASIPLIIPEPATWLLGGSALMGIVALRRRFR